MVGIQRAEAVPGTSFPVFMYDDHFGVLATHLTQTSLASLSKGRIVLEDAEHRMVFVAKWKRRYRRL